MCGIVGYVGRQACVPDPHERPRAGRVPRLRLGRHRRRDVDRCRSRVHRRAGKLGVLADSLPKRLAGTVGIGHTRWATHGAPTDGNAHPHVDASGRVAIVHNGIIENAAELRRELEAAGVELASDTDSETIAHLVARGARAGRAARGRRPPGADADRGHLRPARARAPTSRTGSWLPGAARRSCSASANREMLVASDIAALVRSTRQVVALGRRRARRAHGRRLRDVRARRDADAAAAVHGRLVARRLRARRARALHAQGDLRAAGRRSSAHCSAGSTPRHATAKLGGIDLDARAALGIRRIVLLGCGTAYYAGLAGAQLIEDIARIPATAEPAAEFGYRNPVIDREALYVAISQSGETADTLEAVHEIKRRGGQVIALVNVVGSTIARECDGIYLHAGPEISVASTKAFTSMLVALALLGTAPRPRPRPRPGPRQPPDRRAAGAARRRSRRSSPTRMRSAPSRSATRRRRRCSSSAGTAGTRSRSRARRS